jgi:hypothetical protein
MFQRLTEVILALPYVRKRQSRMAVSTTEALWLPDEVAFGPPEAFIDDHEFCHVHALPIGNMHMTLPEPFRDEMIQLGWGESHPGSEAGFVPQTLVMVYAARNQDELAVAATLLRVSYEYARGYSGPR